jgi:hypothetical protein
MIYGGRSFKEIHIPLIVFTAIGGIAVLWKTMRAFCKENDP